MGWRNSFLRIDSWATNIYKYCLWRRSNEGGEGLLSAVTQSSKAPPLLPHFLYPPPPPPLSRASIHTPPHAATVQSCWLSSSLQLIDVCGFKQLVVYTVFLQLLEQTEEKRRLKTMEKKSINLFYRSNLLCFYLTIFCKIDIGLDTVSFLERLLKVCYSQNSQFFDPSSTVLYILYKCEWVWTNFLLYLFWNILYILMATLHLSVHSDFFPL